jgi:CzcA family heavy metal efflux pump
MGAIFGRLAIRHAATIFFLVVALCIGGGYAAFTMPSAVFPQTDFPRIIIIANNGVMPADEMMASITRPIESAMKQLPGATTIRSSTGRGTAEIDVFFTWDVAMTQSELYVLGRLAEIRQDLPAGTATSVSRMTFSAFPIIGISMTPNSEGESSRLDPVQLWETAEYEIKPRLLRIEGVASIDILGGAPPEYLVSFDPTKLAALHLGITQITDALRQNNLVAPTDLYAHGYAQYLTVVDGRLHDAQEIADLVVAARGNGVVRLSDVATVTRGAKPKFSVVTANGVEAVLLNVYSHPDGSTLGIARQVNAQIAQLQKQFPDIRLSSFYDQSLLVHNSVRSVWEAIVFGLILSIVILQLFLRDWGATAVAIIVIPVTVLFTLLCLKLLGQSLNLMTLGGIAAAIGLIIDDAIVVVEAIHARWGRGVNPADAVAAGISEIFPPLLGSTLTPVVVFIPLAFLSGVTGVFFKALALTMVVALLASLVLALTLTPSLAAWAMGRKSDSRAPGNGAAAGGFIMRLAIGIYSAVLDVALRNRWFVAGICVLIFAASLGIYQKLASDFLPKLDEGGFIIDYITPPGTSLEESNRQMLAAEEILKKTPEVESWSRRTGEALGVHLVEPNTGDFLVKLREDRKRSSDAIINDVRNQIETALPDVQWDFPGILTDLIGDLTWSDEAIEVKIYSTDLEFLRTRALRVADALGRIPGVVDIANGLIYTGSELRLRVRSAEAAHYGLTAVDIAAAVHTAMLGDTDTSVLEGDRLIDIRVKADPSAINPLSKLATLPLRAADGSMIALSQVVDLDRTPGQLELERDDLRQDVAVTANLEGRDLGSGMRAVKAALDHDPQLPPGTVEYGGLYAQQQESFRQLTVVLGWALTLVFAVALAEFRSFAGPIAIVCGAALSVLGIVAALWLTGTTLSIVAFLGAIIGMGVVHKNGILLMDSAQALREEGVGLRDALMQAGQRRLRPVLMTSLAAGLGLAPLAYGIGSGADMLKPLAIAIIGALCVSVLLSLIATPTIYYLLMRKNDSDIHA